MTLIPAMKTRLAAPSDLVDLGHIKELKGIKVSGKTVTIGAGTTHSEVASDEKLKKVAPTVAYLASLIGDPHVRHKRHDRWLHRQQRPGSRLSRSAACSRRDNRYQQARDFCRQILHRPVRDSPEGGRDRHRRNVHRARQGRLREVPQSCLALCHRRCLRRQGQGRCPRRPSRAPATTAYSARK